MPEHQPGQDTQNILRCQSSADLHSQAFSSVLIDYRQHLQSPTIVGPVEHEVVDPNMVLVLGPEPDA